MTPPRNRITVLIGALVATLALTAQSPALAQYDPYRDPANPAYDPNHVRIAPDIRPHPVAKHGWRHPSGRHHEHRGHSKGHHGRSKTHHSAGHKAHKHHR